MTFTARLRVCIWYPKKYAIESQARFKAGLALVDGFDGVIRLRYRQSGIPVDGGASGWEAGYPNAERTGRTRAGQIVASVV